MDLQSYFDRGRYKGFLYLDSLVKHRDIRRGAIALACAIEDLGELEYRTLHYSRPVEDTLLLIGLDGAFWKRHRLGRACDPARRAFLAGFISGIASFRPPQEKCKERLLPKRV